VQRYQVPVPKGMTREEYKSKVQQPMAKRICNVIKYWIEKVHQPPPLPLCSKETEEDPLT
jgi:hypothetical protein